MLPDRFATVVGGWSRRSYHQLASHAAGRVVAKREVGREEVNGYMYLLISQLIHSTVRTP